MSKDTGTAVSVARWFRTIRPGEGSSVELHALDATGTQLVTGWSITEAAAELDRWSVLVCELTTDDAAARGQSTRYELRHKTPEGIRGVTHLRRVVAVQDDPNALDGSQLGLVAQLQRALHQSHSQLLEASRAAIQAQQASMVLLGQAYGHIAALQSQSVEAHARAVEVKEHETRPDMVRTMLETVAPHVGQQLAKLMLETQG